MTDTDPAAATPRATVIGDLVGSRSATDRLDLHRRLRTALERATAHGPAPVTPLTITVGDEFQGSYARLGEAFDATLRVYLALAPDFEVRFGIGWGPVAELEDGIEDGPGWWSARNAIVSVHRTQRRSADRTLYTSFEAAAGTLADTVVDLVNASLVLRDQSLTQLDPTGHQILLQRLDGRTQADIATDLDITPQAVSQRVRRSGLNLILRAEERLARFA